MGVALENLDNWDKLDWVDALILEEEFGDNEYETLEELKKAIHDWAYPPKVKGVSLCNRTACQTDKNVHWWNEEMQAYYCEECAKKINYDPDNILCVEDLDKKNGISSKN